VKRSRKHPYAIRFTLHSYFDEQMVLTEQTGPHEESGLAVSGLLTCAKLALAAWRIAFARTF
jgi:hypothetical protein